MAGFDYGRMQGTATRLMQRFKQGSVTLTRAGETGPPPNEWTPGAPGEPQVFELDATVKGVSAEFVDGTTILATDLEVAAAVFGADPMPADQMTIDGQVVTIIKIMQVPAAGAPVAWKFVVRG